MKLYRCCASLLLIASVSGCASTLQGITDPGMNSDVLNEPGEDTKLRGFKGDRRLVRTYKANSQVYEVCRETWADAIGARSGTSGLELTNKASVSDALAETLTKTTERGAVSDTTRVLLGYLCDFKMNGWVDGAYVAKEFSAIRHDALSALQPAPTPKPPKDIATDKPAKPAKAE